VTLVDSNIVIDVLTQDPSWLVWSIEALDARALRGPLYVNEIIYAEIAVKIEDRAELDSALETIGVVLLRSPEDALHLAGRIFGHYRRSGGIRTGVLPDFFIGAHAQIARLPILTRDTRRYRTYFPKVALIAPED